MDNTSEIGDLRRSQLQSEDGSESRGLFGQELDWIVLVLKSHANERQKIGGHGGLTLLCAIGHHKPDEIENDQTENNLCKHCDVWGRGLPKCHFELRNMLFDELAGIFNESALLEILL